MKGNGGGAHQGTRNGNGACNRFGAVSTSAAGSKCYRCGGWLDATTTESNNSRSGARGAAVESKTWKKAAYAPKANLGTKAATEPKATLGGKAAAATLSGDGHLPIVEKNRSTS